MKYLKNIVAVCILFPYIVASQNDAQAFLPELFKNYPNVRDFAISPNNGDIYFTVDDYKSSIAMIVFISKTENGWSQPKAVSFTGHFRDIEPAFSSDGKRLYFASNRSLDETSKTPKDYDIWYVDQTESGWSEPKNLGAPVNTEAHEYYPSLTKNNDLYFTAEREGAVGREDIFVSRFKNGAYQDPISAKGKLNTKYFEFNAFVAPDESFIIFSSQRPNEGKGSGDLYISYNENNSWGEAKLIETVNSPYLDFCPFVDLNSNRLYFTSQKTDVKSYYEKKQDLNSFLNIYKSSTPKGLNRIYYIDFLEKH